MTLPAIHEQILGISAAIRKVRARIELVGPSELPVLISGPTGTGKELVARAIHAVSGKLDKFVVFNVCAIPESMFEDTLFGHVRGAFTGASQNSPGYLRQADGGTVFIDEIEALNGSTQAKLLRAIETRQFRPVGGSTDVRSDFRLIAATNEDVWVLDRLGKFRKDLAHRLSSFVIKMPLLRERMEDVPILARAFLREMSEDEVSISEDALRVLELHEWPGNVRELRNVVRSAMILGGTTQLRPEIVSEVLSWMIPGDGRPTRRASVDRKLFEVLDRCGWNVDQAARQLGVHRATLYRRLKRTGIPRPDRDSAGMMSELSTNSSS